ncbi:MAG: tyrosine-type recombinase/integrase [Mycobacterium sp.]
MCDAHIQQWAEWLSTDDTAEDPRAWDKFLASAAVRESVSPPSSRGQLSLAALPNGLQNEIRYALHRHAKNARRTAWRPAELQKVVDTLAASGVTSLCDSQIEDLAKECDRKAQRRIWLDLPAAARSLMITEDIAKAAGWFDPILVGSAPFSGTTAGVNRRKVWDLTGISQRWLRDVIWEYLRDEALKPAGKRPTLDTMRNRITGIALLSHILWQNRDDHGDDPRRLGRADAMSVKDTWDLWFREQIPIPLLMQHKRKGTGTLTDLTRHTYTVSMRIVLQRSHEERRTPPGMDSFILGLPGYPQPVKNPRPRPLSEGDFQLLVSAESIGALEALDSNDVGLADIWLTHAFQGGRISETLKLRLGCVGLIGRAQPFIWRDISKVNVVDYGMPCYLPVYQRLLRRQEITRAKLRARYAEPLAALDERGRAQLEANWDRDKPLFPGVLSNPDLALEVSQSGFRNPWTQWFEGLGLKWITTHQTRSTLAMSLLDNGAPPALVRQLLGHFSEESLAHYAKYNDVTVKRHLQQVWAAGPGMDKPGTILLRPTEVIAADPAAAAARIDLTVVPVEHGLCRYGPVVGGAQCPLQKNCTDSPNGPCEHFVLTGADLAYWERKRDRDYHFAERAPTDETRDYILSQWQPWEPVLTGLRDALDELGLLEDAQKLDLRTPVHDYFDPLFSTGFPVSQLNHPLLAT